MLKYLIKFLVTLTFLTIAVEHIDAKPISGAFIQINPHMAGYSQSDWEEEVSLMKQCGMDTVIVSASISDGGKAHYQSSLDFVTEVADTALTKILTACDANQMKCFVGLVHDNRWWSSIGDEAVLSSMAANNIAAADELLSVAAEHASFAGWYVTEEIVFNVWSGDNRDMLINTLLNPVVEHLKSITPDKPAATAPYVYDITAGADNCRQWWDNLLSRVDFDIVMFQDGFGADINRKPELIVPYFKGLRQACIDNGAELWNDLEVFNQPDWTAKTFSDVRWQISLNEKHVSKIVTWEWFYITPTQRMRSDVRTVDRQNLYAKLLSHNRNLKIASLNKNYTMSKQPSASYPDSKNKLTDSQIDFEMDSHLGYYLTSGFGGGTSSVSVTIDLREDVPAEYGFSAVFMNRQGWGVNLPESVDVYISEDNTAFEKISQLETFPSAQDSLNVYFDFPQKIISPRYVRFEMRGLGWLMCSELSVYRSDIKGDYNSDARIDINDVNTLSQKWLDGGDEEKGINYGDFADIARNWKWQRDRSLHFRDKFYKLPNVQLSQGSPYMQNRTVESIASELAVNGVESIFVMQTSVNGLKPGLIDALRSRDIAPGLMLFADAVYTPTSELPEGWEQWKMGFLNTPGNNHLSFIHDGFREWMKQRAVSLCNDNGFAAVTFAEPMYPVYDGITKSSVRYADVSQAYQDIFKADTGESEFPNFTDPSDPHYFKTDTALYQKLVQHRIDSITDYFDEIINGEAGLRESAPDTMVITWSLACSKLENGGVDILPEWEGNDAYSIVKNAKPDMHYYQTHWPDWVDPQLSPEHVYSYIPNFRECWKAAPQVTVGVQDDIGSHDNMRRSNEYYQKYLEACAAAGAVNSTYYCFSLRSDVYNSAPQLKRISLNDGYEMPDMAVSALSAEVDQRADENGRLLLRIHTKDSDPANWLFISEIEINGVSGGFTYSISPLTPPYSGRPDNTGNDLANGVIAAMNLSDPDWVEWAPDVQGAAAYADIVLNLEPGSRVDSIDIYFLKYASTHVYPPDRIELGTGSYDLSVNSIDLEFDQRVHPNSAGLMMTRNITDSLGNVFKAQRAFRDGNMLILEMDRQVKRGDVLSVDIGGISDDPDSRWTTANIARGSLNTAAAGTVVTLTAE
ncbi:hypothetical protein SMSP2_02350 [Limihaloglobus sulfuriphilus]|uniref:DUF4434 domain-containing protein n=1 Tax=Limihaloglobus sulfuriphilus TaxID=1851148 RepID=A0A1Q2MH06_9BACT|nr:DUF4434 domain-containing protein [Limihaloglobus sulfuriphilus]AQQ71971.1 hypothetical protein SMSP2_02350 [Limihaloglobus sulfuriphilus]